MVRRSAPQFLQNASVLGTSARRGIYTPSSEGHKERGAEMIPQGLDLVVPGQFAMVKSEASDFRRT